MLHLAVDLRILDDHFPGIARYSYELVLALGHLPAPPRLTVILPATAQTRFDLTPLSSIATCVTSPAQVFGLSQHWQIPRLLREIRPAVTLFPYYVRPLFSPCPALTVIHDTISWRVPEMFSPAARLQIRLLHHLALARSAGMLTVSHSAAADLAQFYSCDPARITITSEGVSAAFQQRPAAEISALLQKYHLPERYVLYLASDKPHKNIPFLLDVWAGVQSGDVGLVLAGRWFNPATEHLLAAPALASRVWRVADVPERDLPALYSGALALAFPSRYEGFGLPVLEALACGTPALVSNRSSLPEVVGAAGQVLELESAVWRAALERICHDEDWRTALAAQTIVQAARFQWSSAARRTVAAAEQIIQAAGG